MELFRISGPCSRRDYVELWIAIMMIQALVVLAYNGGWLNVPKDRCDLLSVEYLPLVLQVAAPLCATGWAFCASTIRRCRDALFPVHVLLLFSAFFIVSTLTAQVADSGLSGRALLEVLSAMAAVLLGLTFAGLLLLDRMVLDDGSASAVKGLAPYVRGATLFGHGKPGRLIAEWRRRAKSPATENQPDCESLDLSNHCARRME